MMYSHHLDGHVLSKKKIKQTAAVSANMVFQKLLYKKRDFLSSKREIRTYGEREVEKDRNKT